MKTDRYTICFLLFLAFLFIGTRYNRAIGGMGISISFLAFLATYYSSARVIKNEFNDSFLSLGEEDNAIPIIQPPFHHSNKIDGLRVNNRVFKAPTGTDLKIDRNGNVSFAGPGSAMVSLIAGGGYHAPGSKLSRDEKWKKLFLNH